MTPQKVKQIIENGLYQDNLLILIKACDELLPSNPTLWFVLKHIFSMLENEYDDQGIRTERYNEVEKLVPRFNSAIDDPSLPNLNILIDEFEKLT